jgi:hypothetical protein
MSIAECGPFSWRKRRWSRVSPTLAEHPWPPAVIPGWGTFIYSLIQAVHGAKGISQCSPLKSRFVPQTDTPSPDRESELMPALSQLKQWKLRIFKLEREEVSDISVIG